MKLTVKKFTSDKRIDVCDDYDNVLYRTWYPDEKTFELITLSCVEAWVAGFRDGWSKAKNSIGNCEADGRVFDVDKFNERARR